MYNIYSLFFEFGAILAFLLILRQEYKNIRLREILILAFIYGLLLEIINTHLSKSYYYGKDFLFQIYGIPLAIASGWAIVYYTTRKISKKFQFKWYAAPFFMALIAVIFDMVLDPIAIRLGFWSWRISFGEEWFGAPYDNLIGWMAVIWTFTFLINLSEQNLFSENISRAIKYSAVIISPILLSLQITVFVGLSAIFSGRFTFLEILKFYRNGDFSYAYAPEVQVYKFYFFVIIFIILAVFSAKAGRITKNMIK